jgi:hypothetical protein
VGYTWRDYAAGKGVYRCRPVSDFSGHSRTGQPPFKPNAERVEVQRRRSSELDQGFAPPALTNITTTWSARESDRSRGHDPGKLKTAADQVATVGICKPGLVTARRGTVAVTALKRMAGFELTFSPSPISETQCRLAPGDLDSAANAASHETRLRSSETWFRQLRRGRRNPIGYLFLVTLATRDTSELLGEASAS